MDLITTLRPLLQSEDAVYISERVVLSPHIVDLRIMAASEAAARLFGFEHASEIEGQFVSLLHNHMDLVNSRQWAYLRHLGESTPDEFIMRIRRLNGEEVPVRKQVIETTISQQTVWVSKNEQIKGRHTLLEAPPATIPAHDMKSWWGEASLREAELALQEKYGLTGPFQPLRIHSMESASRIVDESEAIRQLDVPGPNRYFQYYCFICNKGWVGRGEPDDNTPHKPPTRCNYCRSKNWAKPVAVDNTKAPNPR